MLPKTDGRDSFQAPNPNDSIPTGVAAIPEAGGSTDTPRLPRESISIPVPNGDALDVPPAPAGDEDEGMDSMGRPIPTEELFVKDAFLVFRALCKLSMKSLVTER